MDGQWSEWTSWSGTCRIECETFTAKLQMLEGDAKSVESLIPKQRRTRTCNNPAPLNDGQACFGEDEEFKPCTHKCVINGTLFLYQNLNKNHVIQVLGRSGLPGPIATTNANEFAVGRAPCHPRRTEVLSAKALISNPRTVLPQTQTPIVFPEPSPSSTQLPYPVPNPWP